MIEENMFYINTDEVRRSPELQKWLLEIGLHVCLWENFVSSIIQNKQTKKNASRNFMLRVFHYQTIKLAGCLGGARTIRKQ